MTPFLFPVSRRGLPFL